MGLVQCNDCGREISENALFCPQCGSALTESGQLMVRLEKILEDLPAVDRERVETIKQAISDGTYAVNAEKVAAEVIRMEMDLHRR